MDMISETWLKRRRKKEKVRGGRAFKNTGGEESELKGSAG